MGKLTDIPLHTTCKLGAIIKMFTTRLSHFGAMIKFWYKIYNPANQPKMARLQCGNLDIAAILNWVCNVDIEHQ